MIPMGLVTGFLGSGKTTLLQKVISDCSDRRLAFVVNECGNVDVDGQLIEIPDDRLVRIPGGSIFCRCLSGELIRNLEAIADQLDSEAEPLDGVIIEASGMADPKVARRMLEETGLIQRYELCTIVAVVDPGSFLKLIHTLPSVIAQVEACELAIVNKTDLYEADSILDTEAEIARINPTADIVRAQYTDVDVDLLAPMAPRKLEGQYALCADPAFARATVRLHHPVDIGWLKAELECIRNELYRCKGFVPTTDATVYVDVSASGVTTRRVADVKTPGHLVFVAPAGQCERTQRLVRTLEKGDLAANAES
jgi:G3E family GTPase